MARINPAWVTEKVALFNLAASEHKPCSLSSSYNSALQEVILQLIKLQIPYKLINNGAGVKTITNQVDTCPKCRGIGKC